MLTSSIPALSGDKGLALTDDPFLANDSADDAGATRFLADENLTDRLTPLPEHYTVRDVYPDRFVPNGAGPVNKASKIIYSNTAGTFLYRPRAGFRIADDLVTLLAAPCELHRLRVRVNGGVEDGDDVFRAEVSLFDGCPVTGGGTLIPGTKVLFNDLQDDIGQFHDLIVDFTDRGICGDGQACQVSQQNCTGGTCGDGSACDTTDPAPACADESECVSSGFVCERDPLEIPSTVWLQIRFDSDDAGIIVGTPAEVGFSSDGYDHPFGRCTFWFGGWPALPHASFWIEMTGAIECETHFLAYLAANPNRPAFLPTQIPPPFVATPTTRLGDDISLTVDNCTLSAYELGVKGTAGPFTMKMDMRWPNINTIRPDTVFTYESIHGEGNAEVARVLIPDDVNLEINTQNSRLFITWEADKSNTGVMEVNFAQASGTDPRPSPLFFAFDVDPNNPKTWSAVTESSGSPFVAYVAVFCRGEQPVGACCPQGPATPGLGTECIDHIPITQCPNGRWLADTTCDENQFDPPCGSAACCLPNGTCMDLLEEDCDAVTGVRQAFALCASHADECVWPECAQGSGDCRTQRLTPACGEASCCNRVCLFDAWCCDVAWDEQCVEEAYLTCALPPPNNSCQTATVVSANGRITVDNSEGVDTESIPGFRCHGDGAGTPGFAPLWFRFVATHTSARLATCASGLEADDSLLEVYTAGQGEPCGTLAPIGCSDDSAGCGSAGANSDLCVTDLTPGNTYYVQLAAKTLINRGPYRLDVQSPCPNSSSALERESEETSPSPSLVRRGAGSAVSSAADSAPVGHLEIPDDPPASRERSQERSPAFCAAGGWDRGTFSFVQVNVDDEGMNIVGDAGNEPSIAISPVDPSKMAIGFRHFETVASNFRQAGMAYSHDAGQTWTFPNVLDPGIFRSDPVLAADTDGNFFYYSLSLLGQGFVADMFVSHDSGVSWDGPTFARGGDKAWMAIDHTSGPGRNNIYTVWTSVFSCCEGHFTRSTSNGATFSEPIDVPDNPFWGTITVGLDGSVYVAGLGLTSSATPVVRSAHLQQSEIAPVFDLAGEFDLGGAGGFGGTGAPNPGGLLGQTWIASDHSYSDNRGNLYILASVGTPSIDPLEVMFTRSEDGGFSWSQPVRVNDDPVDNGAWQWFGTMSVAPNGRIDAIWNDTRNTGLNNLSELFYSYSIDGGRTWTDNVSVSPVFDSWVGWPNQNKIGDYYHMISDNGGASLAFAATFNNEQDVYFMRIEPDVDCNGDGTSDRDEIAAGAADCNGNLVPDDCEPDFDNDGLVNGCDGDMDNDGVDNETDVCDRTPPASLVKADGSRLGDFKSDCDIDLRDYRSFVLCMQDSGPNVPATPVECPASFDFDNDTDADLADFHELLSVYTGLQRLPPG